MSVEKRKKKRRSESLSEARDKSKSSRTRKKSRSASGRQHRKDKKRRKRQVMRRFIILIEHVIAVPIPDVVAVCVLDCVPRARGPWFDPHPNGHSLLP